MIYIYFFQVITFLQFLKVKQDIYNIVSVMETSESMETKLRETLGELEL